MKTVEVVVVRLRNFAEKLKNRGVRVLLSNALSPEVTALYREGFAIQTVNARRNINSKADCRGAVAEVLIS